MITPSFSPTATEQVLPKLALDFTTASLDSRVTFTRTTDATHPATYVASTGYITAATNNQPRFDYNPITLACKGLLIEESRTNICLQSNQFDTTWTNNNTAEAAAQGTSPDGTNNAWSLTNDATLGIHNILQPIGWTATATTVSMYVKYVDHRWLAIRIGGAANNYFGSYDLQNGVTGLYTAGCTTTMTAVGNSWYRITISATLTVVGTVNLLITMNNSDNANQDTYSGTGTKLLMYGVQVETGAFPTSYIPTTSAALTRNADVATMTGTNFSSWFNATQGSAVIGFNNTAIATSTGDLYLWSLTNSSNTSKRISPRLITSTRGQIAAFANDGTSFIYSVFDGTYSSGNAKCAVAFKLSNRFGAVLNGGSVSENTTGTLADGGYDELIFGANSGGANIFNGWIRTFNFYPQSLTNAEIQAFSK